MFKRIFTLLFCLFLILNCSIFSVFAEGESNVPDGYSPCGLNDQVDAFKSYCQSRNLIVEGSGLDVVTAFTTNAYQGAVKKVGLDVNQLQNEIYKRTKDNIGAKWFFTSTGISAYNRIFAELLQNNDLEVGDSASEENNTVYSGKYFVDADGIGCLVYIANSNFAFGKPTQFGTPYKFTTSDIVSLVGTSNYLFEYKLNSTQTFTQRVYYTTSRYGAYAYGTQDNFNSGNFYKKQNYFSASEPNYYCEGNPVIWYSNGAFYIGICTHVTMNGINNPADSYVNQTFLQINSSSSTLQDAKVYYTTNNTVINNNNYEGDTYITNEGDVTNEPEPSPGGKDPGWDVGGGQGSYNDGQGNNYTINFPDFELPDLNIDWSIQGLGNKFPFSIPFDIVSLVTVLNAEPEAPRFQGTVNFGFTTWDYDINLQQFDTVAQVCRIAELLLLVFGLILITRSIIKG